MELEEWEAFFSRAQCEFTDELVADGVKVRDYADRAVARFQTEAQVDTFVALINQLPDALNEWHAVLEENGRLQGENETMTATHSALQSQLRDVQQDLLKAQVIISDFQNNKPRVPRETL